MPAGSDQAVRVRIWTASSMQPAFVLPEVEHWRRAKTRSIDIIHYGDFQDGEQQTGGRKRLPVSPES